MSKEAKNALRSLGEVGQIDPIYMHEFRTGSSRRRSASFGGQDEWLVILKAMVSEECLCDW